MKIANFFLKKAFNRFALGDKYLAQKGGQDKLKSFTQIEAKFLKLKEIYEDSPDISTIVFDKNKTLDERLKDFLRAYFWALNQVMVIKHQHGNGIGYVRERAVII